MHRSDTPEIQTNSLTAGTQAEGPTRAIKHTEHVCEGVLDAQIRGAAVHTRRTSTKTGRNTKKTGPNTGKTGRNREKTTPQHAPQERTSTAQVQQRP